MKKIFFVLTLAAATLFAGCNQDLLDIPQKGVLEMDDFYKTDADAESALAIVYADTYTNFALPDNEYNYGGYFGMTNFQGDDVYLAGSGVGDCVAQREYHDFRYTYDNPVVLAGYTMIYRSIQKCNLVICNFTEERLGSLTPVMKRCVAEARTMRAWDHLLLGIYWGTAPIIEEVITGDARPTNSESQEAMMTWVAKEIDLALPDLDERESVNDKKGAVKMTKGFANAVKGKALMWKGDYAGAKTALGQVISSNKYALLPGKDFTKLLHFDGRASAESVFEFNVVADPAYIGRYWTFAKRSGWNTHITFNWRWENMGQGNFDDERYTANGWGWTNPTGLFAKALIENDGMDSYRRKATIVTYDEILYDMKWKNDEPFVAGKTAFKATDKNRGLISNAKEVYANEGYFNWKNILHPLQGDYSAPLEGATWNLPVMRYAEVLLLYAECCIQTGDKTEALKYINMIQERAGSQTISKEATMEVLKKEKMFELFMEGCRSADLIRWKDYATLKEADSYVPTLRDKFTMDNSTATEHEGYADTTDADYYKKTFGSALGFKEGKHEFLPFPKAEMDLNPNLKQNPGW